jgi:hypothetical protein
MRSMKLIVAFITLGLWALSLTGGTVSADSAKKEAAPVESGGQPAEQAADKPVGDEKTTDVGWPREIAHGDITLLIYQPQLESWTDNLLEARAAVEVKPTGAQESSHYGVVWMTARTEVDKINRQVTLVDLQLTKADFPTQQEKSQEFLDFLRSQVPDKTRVISLDRLEAALEATDAAEKVRGVEVKNDPPRIFYSNVPALLVLIDGNAVLQPMEGTKLQRVINTRVLIVFDPKAGMYYLHLMDGWLEAPALNAGWTVPKKISGDLKKAESSAAASKQINMLDGPPISDDGKQKQTLKDAAKSAAIPTIYLSFVPAELIQTQGAPQAESIPGTDLLWVTNTGDNLFVDTKTNLYYVLLSGRWFRARDFNAQWEYVPPAQLPEGFARIPPDHPKASVLACIPGTEPAKEAVIANSIPQTAAINRATAKLEVKYDGEPKFKDVPETPLEYAVNGKTPVIKVTDAGYYAVENAVWFTGPGPRGPWTVATTVPAVIYTIPPSSPIHYVTYVKIYGHDDQVVYVGYTPGYYGTVVTPEQVVVYGTGWYYPPYMGGWWYGWPCTYGYGATFVWSSDGGWAVGFGVGYGWGWYYPYWGPWGWYGYGYYPPYGWGAWGGYAAVNVYGRWGEVNYAGTRAAWANPWTGNYGGGSRVSAYNPATGAAATAGRFANTNIYTGNTVAARGGAAYNPETGRVVAGGAGYIGNIYTGEGAAGRGGLVYDTDTKTGLAVGKNNVYAGKDGNVYKYDRSSGNWYKNDNGSWNQFDPQRPGSQSSGQARDQVNTQNLQKQYKARSQGEYRSQQYRNYSGSMNRGSFCGGARGGRRR